MSAIPDTKMLCWDQFCVGTTGLCWPKVPTFGCRADMLPTCQQHSQPRPQAISFLVLNSYVNIFLVLNSHVQRVISGIEFICLCFIDTKFLTTEFLCMLDCIIYASFSKPENSATIPLPFVHRFMYVRLHSLPSLYSIALMSCCHCPLLHSITANLVALLHVFVFLADCSFLSCIFYVFLEFWRWSEHFFHVNWFNKVKPDSVRTQDRTTYSQVLNITASPPVGHDVITMTSFDIPCNLCPVVASLLLAGICFILQQFFWWSAIWLDRYFWWALFWFKFEFLVAHFSWQSILQFFKSGLDLKFAWLNFLCC